MRSLFLPASPATDDVADPEVLAQPFQEAYEVATAQTHYQWKEGAITSPDYLEEAEHIVFDHVSQEALLQSSNGVYPVIPDDLGASTNLWKIPYNRGFSVVGTTSQRLTWTSQYPETLWIVVSFVFVRRDVTIGTAAWTAFWAASQGRDPRAQLRIRIDGVIQEGSGPFAYALDGQPRGTGLSMKSCASVLEMTTIVPPGAHSVEVVGAQQSALAYDDSVLGANEDETYVVGGPVDGICIGNIHTMLFRITKGGELTR